jgi:hypothetical protein
VSGSWVVVSTGTLDSGVFENTGAFSGLPGGAGGTTVIARLAPGCAAGLTGLTYW